MCDLEAEVGDPCGRKEINQGGSKRHQEVRWKREYIGRKYNKSCGEKKAPSNCMLNLKITRKESVVFPNVFVRFFRHVTGIS